MNTDCGDYGGFYFLVVRCCSLHVFLTLFFFAFCLFTHNMVEKAATIVAFNKYLVHIITILQELFR